MAPMRFASCQARNIANLSTGALPFAFASRPVRSIPSAAFTQSSAARSLGAREAPRTALRKRNGLFVIGRRSLCRLAAAAEAKEVAADDRLPVTVITGFLGSGKTTLLNSILTKNHGKRIAVIENEFGEIDIDSELVVKREVLEGSTDSITQLSNGCLCCTVRDDLIRVLNKLWMRRHELDHVLIETTGLANPAPIISSFFMDQELPDRVRLDGVVTVVDAKFVERHLSDKKEEGVVNEAVEQIAYADRIVLNKTDLVDDRHLVALEARIRSINQMATMQRTTNAEVPVDFVLGVGGFDLDAVERELNVSLRGHTHEHDHEHEHDHDHEHGHDHDKDCSDPACTDESHNHNHDHDHEHQHGAEGHDCAEPACTDPSHNHDHDHDHDHQGHDHGHGHAHVEVAAALKHDDKVASVSIVLDGDMDLDKINYTLGMLLETRSEDIYRMKGLLSIAESEFRFVYQGVHMMFEGAPDRKWAVDEKRTCKMVFIGRELDKEAFTEAFANCLVPRKQAVGV